jgi:hypothetical protein
VKKIIFLYFIFFVKISLSQINKEHLKDFKIIIEMMDSVKNLHSIRFNMKSLERIETGYETSYTNVKLQISSRKVYLKNPSVKLELLYNSDKNKVKCLVKPHVFPYFTLSLDPRGNLMRKNQHFTINEIGFDFTVKTIAIALSKEKNQIAKHLTLLGKVEKNGMTCYLIIYENQSFSYFDHIVGDKETVESISNKYIVNEYMVRTKNKLFDDYGYLKKGTIVKIPNFYCKKGIFYVDEKSMLPVSITIFDEVGVFESYEYTNLEINKPIPPAEFERNYKGYGF